MLAGRRSDVAARVAAEPTVLDFILPGATNGIIEPPGQAWIPDELWPYPGEVDLPAAH